MSYASTGIIIAGLVATLVMVELYEALTNR
jgi:hypothetical protein